MKELFDLFYTFSKVGILMFGGGYAMLPMLQREIVEKKKWATAEEVIDYFAIGQTSPGIISVNTATFIGQKQRGTLGGIAAVFGLIFPSYIIITIIAIFMSNFADSAILQNAFAGIRVSVYILILNAVIKLWKTSVVDKTGILIFLFVFTFSIFTAWSPVFFVILAALAGIFAKKNERRRLN